MPLRREKRPPHLWRPRDAVDAYVVGFVGKEHVPETDAIRAERICWAAASFHPAKGSPMLWRAVWGEGFAVGVHVTDVFCGFRGSLWDACEGAIDWVRWASRDMEEGATSSFDAFNLLGDFEAAGRGLLRETLRSMPEPEGWIEPGGADELDDFALWSRSSDRAVPPGHAVTIRESLGLEEAGSDARPAS